MKDISRCSYLFSLQTLDISEFLHFPLPPTASIPGPQRRTRARSGHRHQSVDIQEMLGRIAHTATQPHCHTAGS